MSAHVGEAHDIMVRPQARPCGQLDRRDILRRWTDDRHTAPRTDVREAADDDPTRAPRPAVPRGPAGRFDHAGTSARNGGLDQHIYGDLNH